VERKIKYRRLLYCLLFLSLILMGTYGMFSIEKNLPRQIKLFVDQEEEFNFNLPVEAVMETGEEKLNQEEIHINLGDPFTLSASNLGNYELKLKLFGLFDVGNMQIDVVEEEELIPCGAPIGIYIRTDGVMVLGTGQVAAADGLMYEPAYNIIQSGDYITEINGQKITGKQELVNAIKGLTDENVVLGIRRNEEETSIKLKAVDTGNGEYKLGIWVRDDTQGIGTMTYIDKESNFGALGHGINDVDTGQLLEIESGNLYETKILSIVKGEKGSPGELMGMIDYSDEYCIGTIHKNTSEGIFGTFTSDISELIDSLKPMKIGLKQKIQIGPAKVRCYVNGEMKDYDIEITKIDLADDNVNKGMVIQVVDSELLEYTNGIVQGMSGSPIIQNDCIIGAVTHVFVQDSTKGYGIFIENMIRSQK
jgi:stage IV sporulation protein B